MIARYRALLSHPGVSRLLVSSVVGRLPSGMFSLAILLFFHARAGSFLAAGVAVGAFTLASALVGPLLGALVDRVGQAPVLLPAAACQAAALVALVLSARAGAPVAALIAVVALAGAALPPLAGCVRALWPQVASGEQLQTAYALDATSQETIWTLGPLLVGVATGFISPAAGVLLCALLTVCGTGFFVSSPLSRHWHGVSARERSRGGALRAGPGLRVLLCSVALAGAVIGAVEVGLPALATHAHAHWSAGPLLALFSVGSMTGGLVYSARSWRLAIAPRYTATLVAMALAVAPLIVVGSLTAAFPLSVLAGLALAPMMACQFSLVGELAPAGTVTEAFTWHRAATVAGMAAGTALGGWLIDSRGVSAAFALGCVGVAAAGAVTVLGRRHIAPAAPAAAPEQAPFELAAEAVALAAEAVALAARSDGGELTVQQPRTIRLAVEAVALAAQAVAQGAV
ncbi:MAG TPA: MFS transporter [Solirubrobacteraceae bacterium]|nr:MFS transporter [Solirubrobacteraceae bacterium]